MFELILVAVLSGGINNVDHNVVQVQLKFKSQTKCLDSKKSITDDLQKQGLTVLTSRCVNEN